VALATAAGVTLLRRLPREGPDRPAGIPPGRGAAFRFWVAAQTVAVLVAVLLQAPAEGWSVLILSGTVLGILSLSYEVWPAVVVGWSAAWVSPLYLTFAQLKGTDLEVAWSSSFLWAYIAVLFVLCLWTVLRRQTKDV